MIQSTESATSASSTATTATTSRIGKAEGRPLKPLGHRNNQLRACRIRAEMTQQELAERLGVGQTIISRAEHGRRTAMSREKWYLAAELFGVDPRELDGYWNTSTQQ